jgi:hypothetical protein
MKHSLFVGDSSSLRESIEKSEVLIPVLYLKGVSTGDFEEALVALLGKDAGRAFRLDHSAAQKSPH